MKGLIIKFTFVFIISIAVYFVTAKPLILVNAEEDYIVYSNQYANWFERIACINFDDRIDPKGKCKFGLMNSKGDIIYNTKYDYIYFLKNTILLGNKEEIKVLERVNPKNVLHSYDSTFSVNAIYDDGVVIGSKDKRFFIDEQGKEVVFNFDYELKPNYFSLFKNGFALIESSDHKVGLINQEGDIVLNPIYQHIKFYINDNLLLVSINQNGIKWGIMNTSGEYVVDPVYESLYEIPNKNYLIVSKDEKNGVISIEENILVDFNYTKITYLENNQFLAYDGHNYSIINDQDETLKELNYEEVSLNNGILEAKNSSGLIGILDLNGNVLTEVIFEDVIYFTDDLIGVKQGEKWGIIDDNGNTKVNFIYDSLSKVYSNFPETHEFIIVKLNNQFGLIGYAGEQILDVIYQDIRFGHHFVATKLNDKWTIKKLDGTVLLDNHTSDYNLFSDLTGQWIQTDDHSFTSIVMSISS